MRTVEIKVYSFDELSDEAKAIAIENHRTFEVENFEWWDVLKDRFVEDLNAKGFLEPEPYFSGFNNQGDGACFDCKAIDLKAIFESGALDIKDYRHMDSDAIINNVKFSVVQCGAYNIYSHSKTRCVELDVIYDSYSKSALNRVTATIRRLEADLTSLYRELCDQYYRDLEKEYEYRLSDECVSESLRANDMEFTEDGNDF